MKGTIKRIECILNTSLALFTNNS